MTLDSHNYFPKINIRLVQEHFEKQAKYYYGDDESLTFERIVLYRTGLKAQIEKKIEYVVTLESSSKSIVEFSPKKKRIPQVEFIQSMIDVDRGSAFLNESECSDFYTYHVPNQCLNEWRLVATTSGAEIDFDVISDSRTILYERTKQPVKKRQYPNNIAKIKTGSDIQWADVIITFISDEEVLVQFGGESVARKFNNAGFEDRRNGTPINSWIEFCKAASNEDRCIKFTFANRKKLEKIAQELNKKLLVLFPDMRERPVRLTKENKSYQFAFQLEFTI